MSCVASLKSLFTRPSGQSILSHHFDPHDGPPTRLQSTPRRRGGRTRLQTPDGLTLAAQAQGSPDAPEVLFIHGLAQCHLSWTQQVNASDLTGCRRVTFDLRGQDRGQRRAVFQVARVYQLSCEFH